MDLLIESSQKILLAETKLEFEEVKKLAGQVGSVVHFSKKYDGGGLMDKTKRGEIAGRKFEIIGADIFEDDVHGVVLKETKSDMPVIDLL